MAVETSAIPRSDLAIPPGEFLAEEIEARGMTPPELASRMGCSVERINGVVAGREEITEALADKMEAALGLSAAFWLRLERDYRQTLARG